MIYVLLLAFDENEGIGASLRRLHEILGQQDESVRYVVVDDGSTDGTPGTVDSLSRTLPITLLRHPVNLGVARAFDTGLRHIAGLARPGDLVFTLEGDNTNDPGYILEMRRLLREGRDVVCASRYRPGGAYVGFPPGRRFFSLCANALMRLIFGVPGVGDYTIFYRGYTAAVLQRALDRYRDRFIQCSGFPANVEILMRVVRSGPVRCGEVPLVYRYDRKKGRSKMRVPRNIFRYGRLLWLLASEALSRQFSGPRPWMLPAALALAFGGWGMGWQLPSKDRLERVFPPGLDSPDFRQRLHSSWGALRARMGPASLLSPDAYSQGFDRMVSVPAGWEDPPDALLNTIRSQYLRSGSWDEPNILHGLSQIKPHKLKINPGVYWYGAGYLYALGLWIAAGAAVTPAQLVPSLPFYLEDPSRMAWLYLLGRSFSVLVWVLGAVLLYGIGRRHFGERAGLWAALFFATAPGLLIQAHVMKPHLMAAVLLLLGFGFCLRALETDDSLHYLSAGAAFGWAAGCAVNQAVGCLLIPMTALLRLRRGGGDWKRETKHICWAAAAAILFFLAANPFFILEPVLSYRGMRAVSALLDVSAGKVLQFVTLVMPAALTVPVCAWIAAGLVSRTCWREDRSLLAAAGLVLLIAYSATFQSVEPLVGFKYFAGTAIAFLLVGRRIDGLLQQGTIVRRATIVLAGLSLGYAVLSSAMYGLNYHRDSTSDSTHHRAGRWLESEIPPGSEIGFLRAPQPLNMPFFRLDKYRLRFIDDKAFPSLTPRELPEYLVLAFPGYDDLPVARGQIAAHYRLAADFPAASLAWMKPPRGKFLANPPLQIYRKK